VLHHEECMTFHHVRNISWLRMDAFRFQKIGPKTPIDKERWGGVGKEENWEPQGTQGVVGFSGKEPGDEFRGWSG